MQSGRLLGGLAWCIGVQTIACGGGSQFGKIGPAFPLPNGTPRTACEQEEWYELAPARVEAQGMTAGVGFNTYYRQVHEGVGVFRGQSNDPEDLENLWPKMGEPDLQSRHQARIEPVDAASRRATYYALGSLVGLFGGVGIAAAIQHDSPTGATVAGVSGITIGLVGVVAALVAQPSGRDQLEADARRKLFIRGEDDAVAATRGINNVNGQRRRQCGGTTAPSGPLVRPESPPSAP